MAGTVTAVSPTAATTSSFQTTRVAGVAIGNASFSGTAQVQAHSSGHSYSGWAN
jgi:hypothetical protein